MSKSIELLVKLHNPKCVSIETAGRGGVALLYKEQIYAWLSFANEQIPPRKILKRIC